MIEHSVEKFLGQRGDEECVVEVLPPPESEKEWAVVDVLPVKIVVHPAADLIEIAEIGLYQSIVRKGTFVTGELVGYIPEQSLLPVDILREVGLFDEVTGKGKLSGPEGNRIKAIRLRGITSQGLVIKTRPHWKEGDVVGKELGIEKYVPKWGQGSIFKRSFSGQMINVGSSGLIHYDIDNIKKNPDIIEIGEDVIMTEKAHGTLAMYGLAPTVEHPTHEYFKPYLDKANHGRALVSSKGLAKQGAALKYLDVDGNWFKETKKFVLDYQTSGPEPDLTPIFEERIVDVNKENVYVKTGVDLDIWSILRNEQLIHEGQAIYILGEIIGVQDLAYGCTGDAVEFRVFDMYVGMPGTGHYLSSDELDEVCEMWHLKRVPILYRGPFTWEALKEHTNGRETISGKSLHIREGVVVRSAKERRSRYGRVQYKSISDAYLLRGGKKGEAEPTEFN